VLIDLVLGIKGGGAVVDAGADQLRQAGRGEPTVRDPGRDQHAAGPERGLIREVEDVVVVPPIDAYHLPRAHDFGTETACLDDHPPR
jgi:hypothetical protein